MKDESIRVLPGVICDVKHTLFNNDDASDFATTQALYNVTTVTKTDFDIDATKKYVRDTISKLKDDERYSGDVNKIKRTRKAFHIFMEEFRIKLGEEQLREMERIYVENYFDERFFYGDVKRTIPELYKICKLGINTSCDTITGSILREMPIIKNYFGDKITVAGETGIWTKDANSIKDTLGKMKTDPKKTIMVGDILPDFIGANELGLPTVLIKRHPITDLRRAYNEPDLTITRFDDTLYIARMINEDVPIERIKRKADAGISFSKMKF